MTPTSCPSAEEHYVPSVSKSAYGGQPQTWEQMAEVKGGTEQWEVSEVERLFLR